MQIEFQQGGIYLPEIQLWLDCTEDCEAVWISHGHGDHAGGVHGLVYATGQTLQFYHAENGRAVDYRVPWEHNGARLTAHPASHIVGAAQLLIEYRGERVLYTGDIKLRAPICGDQTEIVECDRLIIESTFGLPIYHFLPREEARRRIVEFAQDCLAAGIMPAYIGYPLGRGQEIAHVLCEAGIPVAVHGAIAHFIPIYEANGYAFPGWTPYKNGETDGKALVTVPGFRNFLEAGNKAYRLAYVSGWAALDNARARVGAEELIPYSDHADFDELLEIVTRTTTREVDVVHGYTELFAQILLERGIEARAPREMSARASSGEVPEG